MIIAKNKRKRLNDTKQLNEQIHKRDKNSCVVCGAYVSDGEKWHHEPCGIGKEDVIEKGCLLCQQCHYERHNGKRSLEIKRKAEEYLKSLYLKHE